MDRGASASRSIFTMATKEQHIFVRCPTCRGAARPGLIWLGGKDYVECPDCQGTGKVEILEKFITPTAHSVLVPGRRDDLPAVAVAAKVRDNP